MKKFSKKKKKFLLHKQEKLMRQRRRRNKGSRSRLFIEETNHSFRVNVNLVQETLEKNGFGKNSGDRILKENGISVLPSKKNRITPKEIVIRIPEVFSISEDSDSVIGFLRECYGLIVNNNVTRILFDHTSCRVLGLSASTLMDVVVIAAREISNSKRRRRAMESLEYSLGENLEFSGLLDTESDASKILAASGLPKHINARFLYGDEVFKDGVKPLDVINGITVTSGDSKSSTYSTKLTQYFQKCLNKEGLDFTEKGALYFTELFAEVLSNCERHGGEDGTWYTQGVYLRKEYGGEMQLFFMNIGETIYDGLLKHSTAETEQRLNLLLKRHREFFGSQWNKEMLFTLFALQDGVSRVRDKNRDGYEERGSGTITMITAFQAIGAKYGNTAPQLTIVSGNTRIVFDDRYKLEEVPFNDEIMGMGKIRKVIAFNDKNDIYKPADSRNVMKCRMRFPGTVISIKFALNKLYIEKQKRV